SCKASSSAPRQAGLRVSTSPKPAGSSLSRKPSRALPSRGAGALRIRRSAELILLGEPLEDESEEALGAALVAPAEVPETARAIRNAPRVAREPGVLVACRALRGATGRRAKAAEMEVIARRVGAPVLVSALDRDAFAMARDRVGA